MKFLRYKNKKEDTINNEYKKDRKIVKDYYDTPYPRGLHDVNLYDSVDYMAGLCNSFIYYPTSDLNGHLNVFSGSNQKEIEHKILLYGLKELNDYYDKMITSLDILGKYYNEDGTLK